VGHSHSTAARHSLGFHQQAADELGGDEIGRAGENALGEMVWELLGGRGGYWSDF